jgi:signal transduction histidine kinase
MQENELRNFIHDIATPLTMVKINMQLLDDSADAKNKRKLINRINHGIGELDYLITMNSNSTYTTQLKSTAIHEIQKIVRLYNEIFIQNNIQVYFDFKEDYFLVQNVDKFHRIIINLIDNAVETLKYKKGLREIEIKSRREDEGFLLSITDNGCGISPQNINRIFDYQFSTKPSGKGIGLYNVKNMLLQYFNGFIVCNSEVGKGTEFEIILQDPC